VVSKKSSAYASYRKAVNASGEVEVVGDQYRSLPQFAESAPLDTAATVDEWASKLPQSYGKMLKAIAEHGALTKEEVAVHAGVSPTSSGLSSGLGQLVSLQIVAKADGKYELAAGLS
jgi:hypothetical protein